MNFKFQDKYDLFIGGEFVPAESGKYFPSYNPATGEKNSEVAFAETADIDKAVKAAQAAFPAWAAFSPIERGLVLLKIADIIDANAEMLATAETMDNGKPLGQALGDISCAADQFRYFAGCMRAEEGAYVPYDKDSFSILSREPLGVVGQIIPWNFPLSSGSWKLAPALAAGNCCVFKPASATSISILILADLIKDVLPKGVLNIVTGKGSVTGMGIATHPGIRKIAFTGSTEIGAQMGSIAGQRIVPSTMELGGKSANVVFDDCQWDRAVDGAMGAMLYNQGEVCGAGSRLLLQDTIYDRFVEALAKKFEAVRVGNGLDPDTDMGPIIDDKQLEKILSYIEIGKAEGARLVTGGHRKTGGIYDKGLFVEPTIFADVTNDMRIAREEIFGPVLSVIKFHNEQEAIDIMNDSDYGLAGGVWTQDINKALRVARSAQTGTVWVNHYGPIPSGCAYGGYKNSGYYREVGKEALMHYSQVKNIYINMVENG